MQLSMFKEDLKKVVNVSKIPQISPFRFPGGKTWLVPIIRRWLLNIKEKPSVFIEPFAGGGIVSLTVASENLSEKVIMVELDDEIAAVWKTILGNNYKWLSERIISFNLTFETAKEILNQEPKSLRDKAFQTILKNRIFHGGILAKGSGMLKKGENGKGIHSRWYPETLRKRINKIALLKNKISFIEGDGLAIMEKYNNLNNCVFFLDPPYTAGGKRAGSRLYRFSKIDHEKIFHLASKARYDCLFTYDNAPEVKNLAEKYGFDTRLIAMQNTHLSKMLELLIGKDLSWLD